MPVSAVSIRRREAAIDMEDRAGHVVRRGRGQRSEPRGSSERSDGEAAKGQETRHEEFLQVWK